MSQRYGTVHARFWTDEKVQGWTDRQKLAALYLLTGPHSTIAGAMRMPLQYMAADLGWSLKDCQETVARLSEEGFLTYCGRSFWCVVTNRLEYDGPKNPASLQGVVNVLHDLPSSHPGWPDLFVILQGLSGRFKVALPWSADDFRTETQQSADSQETVSKLCAAPAAAAAAVSAMSKDIDSLSPRPRMNGYHTGDFERFWKSYPRRVGKGQAEKAYAAALRRKVEPKTIDEGLNAAIKRWRDDGTEAQFIPHPATWLNGERWADQPPALLPKTDWRLDPKQAHVPG